MVLGDAEIAKPLLRAAGAEIDLRADDFRAVHAKQPLAGMNVLAGLVDVELFDVPVRAHGDYRQPGFVVPHRAEGADRTHDRSRLD